MLNNIHDPYKLLETLCSLPRETGWVEFKENKFHEDNIGKYVSSLANTAMFEGENTAYLVFGVQDNTHNIVGTSVELLGETVGSENFLFWLSKHISPKITVKPISFEYSGKKIEILCIDPGYIQPVKFNGISYIRIDSNQQPLSNHPERERRLWQITSQYSFENMTIERNHSRNEIFEHYDVRTLCERINIKNLSDNGIISSLEDKNIIKNDLQGKFEISALLAMAAAKNLDNIPTLENRGLRVIKYKGRDKMHPSDDIEGKKGYIIGFQKALIYIMQNIPSSEEIIHGIRKKTYKIPEIAIREFLANCLVHQDFTQSNSRPVVELYKDRIKIINPGEPLVSVDRFIDSPSKTRNPRFARLMREAGICEERGSGVDRAIREIEKAALPPPLIEKVEGSTVITIFMPRRFSEMTSDERIRACFQHACICYEAGEPMSNSSLRQRLGLSQKQYPQVSNVIRDTIEAQRIRPFREDQGNRNARYVPFYVM